MGRYVDQSYSPPIKTRVLRARISEMCNLYSITTNQAAIIALFRVINRYVGNLPAMPGVFPDYPAPVIRNTDSGNELTMMRWGMPPPPSFGGAPVTKVDMRDETLNVRKLWLGRLLTRSADGIIFNDHET